jgi:hypothetical protein
MSISNLRRKIDMGLIVLVAAALFLAAPIAFADSHNDHNSDHSGTQKNLKIVSISDKTSNSVVLSIKYKKFRNEKVDAIVSVKKKGASSSTLVEKTFMTTLNDKGKSSVTVSGLKSGTRYEFKVRLMKVGSDKSTSNSTSRSAKTI